MESTCLVVGGSLAGTFAAAAAAPHFERVVVLERDRLETDPTKLSRPDNGYEDLCQEADRHRSVFQCIHVHVLLAGGAAAVEELLPGFQEVCRQNGATMQTGKDMVIGKTNKLNFGSGPFPEMLAPEDHSMLIATRLLMERCARAKLLEAFPNVEFRAPGKVEDILYDQARRQVTGVRLSSKEELHASLVVDATGSRSHAVCKFLLEQCGQQVETIRYDVGLSYHTRFFKVPEEVLRQGVHERTIFAGYFAKAPVSDSAVLQIVEGNMYQVVIARMNGQKCGSRLEDFLDLLKSLPDPSVYEVVRDAEPVGSSFDVIGMKGTHRHFFERLDMPENYVVVGDAVAHLNPRFGSGMTSAAFQAVTLRNQLAQAAAATSPDRPSKTLTAPQLKGYSNKIQRQVARALDLPFSLVRDGDLEFDFCKGPRPSNPLQGLMGAYVGAIVDLLPHSKQAALTWLEVTSFQHPPTKFFEPAIMRQVLAHLMARRWKTLSSSARTLITAIGVLLPAVSLAMLLRAL